MADIFISYSKVQRHLTEQLAVELEAKGFTVWWDASLAPGDNFRDVILAELAKARAAIIIWTPESIKSEWVISEATIARNRDILITVRDPRLDPDLIPMPFGVRHAEPITNRFAIDSALKKLGVTPPIRNSEQDYAPAAGRNTLRRSHLVILIHGINTRGLWMDEVKPSLERAGFAVAATSYGKFSVLRFLSPLVGLRRKAIERVTTDIRTAIRVHNRETGSDPDQMSVISHSFGTYVVSRILVDHPDIKWTRIIFCGSVVREDFPFEKVLNLFEQPLLNEVGTKDYWPAVAESAGWEYGSVGSSGFNRPPVETRWHRGFRHSDFLNEKFCDVFWIPFLQGNKPIRADKSQKLPLWIDIIAHLPLRLIFPLFFLGLTASILFWVNSQDFTRKLASSVTPSSSLSSDIPVGAQDQDITTHPEEATIFIEVHIQTTDSDGRRQLTKVAEGSAILISQSGWILTAAHLTKIDIPSGANLVLTGSINSRFSHKFPLQLPPQPPTSTDAMLLRFPPGLEMVFPYLCVEGRQLIAVDDKLTAIGFPLGYDVTIERGTVTSLSGPPGLIQTNARIASGMSGGPVLNDKGLVIGVVAGGLDQQAGFGFFTPTNLVAPLLSIVQDNTCPQTGNAQPPVKTR